MKYRTIVADPPWPYDEGWPSSNGRKRIALPYKAMPTGQIAMIPVDEHVADDAHLFLWAPNRYVIDAHAVARAWGFRPSQLLTWCKPPMGIGPGGDFATTSEFILYCRRGKPTVTKRVDSSWWVWPRAGHSEKPEAFYDLVEWTCDGPYLEMFARRARLGFWDYWGDESLGTAELPRLAFDEDRRG